MVRSLQCTHSDSCKQRCKEKRNSEEIASSSYMEIAELLAYAGALPIWPTGHRRKTPDLAYGTSANFFFHLIETRQAHIFVRDQVVQMSGLHRHGPICPRDVLAFLLGWSQG